MQKSLLFSALSLCLLSACGGGSGGNSAPVFTQTSPKLTVNEDTSASLLLSATDADNDPLSYSLENAPKHGTTTINAQTGEVNYQGQENFHGSDSFSVLVQDASHKVALNVEVTIVPVNDLPVFVQSNILVSGADVKQGQITVTDIDGDALTFVLVTAPVNGQLTLNPQTGEVSYQLDSLINVDDSFVVSVSDGAASVEQQLRLSTSLSSNIDRAYYYYASELSHLKQAQTLLKTVSDDVSSSRIMAKLAKGYANAGLLKQAQDISSKANITQATSHAIALVDLADEYQLQAQVEQANRFRLQAKSEYNQYLAEKGLRYFNREDLSFYLNLEASYRKAGQVQEALGVFEIIDLLFSAVLTQEYNTAALSAYFKLRDSAETQIKRWNSITTEDERTLAKNYIDKMHKYANRIGYSTVKNNRNGNLDKPFHSIRQVALNEVVRLYTQINERKLAKQAAADFLALHGVVNYDPSYPRSADPFAEVTNLEYPGGVWSNVAQIITLYPEMDANIIANVIPDTSSSAWMKQAILQDAEDARLAAKVRLEVDGAKALALVKASRDDKELRNYFTNLIRYGGSTPGFVDFRLASGDYVGAQLGLDEAELLLQNPEYIKQNVSIMTFVMGSTGCLALLEQYQTLLAKDSDNKASYLEKSRGLAKMCVGLAQTYYAEGVDGTDIEIKDAINANSDIIEYLYPLGMTEEIDTILLTAEHNLAKIDRLDSEYFTYVSGIAHASYQGGAHQSAIGFYQRAIASIVEIEKTLSDSQKGLVVTYFMEARVFLANYRQFMRNLSKEAGKHPQYATLLAQAKSTLLQLIDPAIADIKQAAEQTRIKRLPLFAAYLANHQFYKQALALGEDSALGAGEKAAIITDTAIALSIQDDFTDSPLASVDTDGDGKPNFFAAYASAEDIEASGLVLDEDSDNDGVEDSSDAYPLDSNKH
jgi:hypothetical protein